MCPSLWRRLPKLSKLLSYPKANICFDINRLITCSYHETINFFQPFPISIFLNHKTINFNKRFYVLLQVILSVACHAWTMTFLYFPDRPHTDIPLNVQSYWNCCKICKHLQEDLELDGVSSPCQLWLTKDNVNQNRLKFFHVKKWTYRIITQVGVTKCFDIQNLMRI